MSCSVTAVGGERALMGLEEDRFAVRAPHAFERVADLKQRAVGASTVEHGPDHVVVGFGRLAQCLEAAPDQCVVTLGAEAGHAAPLPVFGVVRDLEDLHWAI